MKLFQNFKQSLEVTLIKSVFNDKLNNKKKTTRKNKPKQPKLELASNSRKKQNKKIQKKLAAHSIPIPCTTKLTTCTSLPIRTTFAAF